MPEGELPPRSLGEGASPARRVGFGRTLLIVAGKDLAGELRSREGLGAMLVFALLALLILSFALELEGDAPESLVTGILWLTLAFAGTLGLNRSMASERDQGCLDGLLLTPADRSAVFFGKALANLVLMLLVAAILLPLISALFNSNLLVPGLLAVVVLGSVGYVSVGTLAAVMAIEARTRDILLPILLFPLAIPVLLACVRASRAFVEGWPASDVQPWLSLLIAFDVILGTAAWIGFDYVAET